MNKSLYLPFLALLTCLTVGCEEAFVKTISVGKESFPPTLSVMALLDADTTGLQVNICRAFTYSEYKGRNPNAMAVATLRLMEDGNTILTDQPTIHIETGEKLYYPKLKTTVGSTYRLEIEVDGYPTAVAEAVMPAAPALSEISIDTTKYDTWSNLNYIFPLEAIGISTWGDTHPLSFKLTDSGSDKRYFVVTAVYKELLERSTAEPGLYTYPSAIVLTDQLLIQENPDYESQHELMSDMEANRGNATVFMKLLFSNTSFVNTSRQFNLNIFSAILEQYLLSEEFGYYPQPQPDYDQSKYEEVHMQEKLYLNVTEISPEAFECYRSMSFQGQGLGFFTEPVMFASNFQGAFGCFSVQHTVHKLLCTYEAWAYYELRLSGG